MCSHLKLLCRHSVAATRYKPSDMYLNILRPFLPTFVVRWVIGGRYVTTRRLSEEAGEADI